MNASEARPVAVIEVGYGENANKKMKLKHVSEPSPTLNLVVIRSSDIEAAAAFYRTMGLEFEKHRHGRGPEHYATEGVARTFEIYPASEKSGPSTGARLGFGVANLDAVVERLAGIGAQVVKPPQESEWGRRAVVVDPDGHRVELTEYVRG